MIATANPSATDRHPPDQANPAPGTAPNGAAAPPGGPTAGTTGTAGNGATTAAPARRLRLPSTPVLLRLGMALACLPVVFFAAAVQLGVARNDSTLRTVGRDATEGITIAQAIKQNLAELDEIVARRLLEPGSLGPSGFPAEYDDKRAELHSNLALAAFNSTPGAAYEQPLVNIDYVVAHYHTLVRDAFAAGQRGDAAEASDLYGQAHEVAEDTLLTEADFVDKANTYVLNDAYDTQTARSASTDRVVVVSTGVLVAFLVVVQLLLARKFRRALNLGLVAATLVAAGAGAYSLARLDASSSHLTSAREQAFDSVHVLARARATVVSARQAQAHLLLDPSGAADAEAGFDDRARELFRIQGDDDVATVAQAGAVPDGAGGFLARVARADATGPREEAVRRTVVAFGNFLAADADMRGLVATGDTAEATSLFRRGVAFNELTAAIDGASAIDQATFDHHVDEAVGSAAYVGQVATIAAGAVLLLALLGLYQRLREYRT